MDTTIIARVGVALLRAALVILFALVFARTAYSEAVGLASESAVLRLFPDYDAQARLVQGAELYDALKAADAELPREATVLFITSGADPRHDEYVAFHRALYWLAPRPVWWANPAQPDGTWESRWWIQTPLSSEHIEKLARAKYADVVLLFEMNAPLELDVPIWSSDNTTSITARAAPPPTARWGLIVGVGILWVLGLGVVEVASFLNYRVTRLEQFGLAFPVGAGVASVLMFWLNGLGLMFDVQLRFIAIVGIFVGAVSTARRFKNKRMEKIAAEVETAHCALRPVEVFLIFWILLQIAFVALLAVGEPLKIWDSWVTYALKAREIVLENSITPHVYADASRVVTHLDYPLLLPLVEAWTFGWANSLEDRLAGIVSVGFFMSLLGVAFLALQRRGVQRTPALALVALLSSLTYVNGAASAVFADLPLAVFALIASIYAIVWLETRSPGALYIAALAAGLMPWTKREGVILLGALGVVLLLIGWRTRAAWLAVAAFVLSALILSGAWWLLVARDSIPSADFSSITLVTLQMNLARLPSILYHSLIRFADPDWLGLWLIVAGLVLLKHVRHRWNDILLDTLLLYIVLILFSYIFSDFVPFQQHVVSSIDRIAAQIAALLVVWGGGQVALQRIPSAKVKTV